MNIAIVISIFLKNTSNEVKLKDDNRDGGPSLT